MVISVKVSWYNPELGGTNCYKWGNGTCLSNMASGKDWRKYFGEALACPRELPFGTRMEIDGRSWTCWDRGGAIAKTGQKYWVDMLNRGAVYPFGTVIDNVKVWLPK